jgi:transposase
MANLLKMALVDSIVTLHGHGWSRRRIARELGIHRETVGRYVDLAAEPAGKAPLGSALAGNAPLGPATDALNGIDPSKPATNAPPGSTDSPQAGSTGSRQAGPPSSASPWREVIVQKLDQGLTAQRIYQDLASEHGYTGSYYSVRRLIKKLTGVTPPPFRRMECEPAAEAQVDFGRGASIVGADGKRRGSWVFRLVLSHSRRGYSEAVSRQTTDEFLRCIENAFARFGGVPRTLVIDNLRAAVTQADWFDPELNPKVQSFCRHYGIAILPTRPYTPRHKGKIERGIGYVKDNALKGHTFASIADQNRHLLQWESQVADKRIHGTTRQQISRVFEQVEKPALAPLPAMRFELFQEALRHVNRDGHVQIKGAYYSAPPEYLGQNLWARWDGRTVRLLNKKMEQVAVHVQQEPGRFATDNQHILPEKISKIENGAAWLLERIERFGPGASEWSKACLQSRGIEAVRVLMGLLSLGNKHPWSSVDEACRTAHGHGSYRLRCVRKLIEHKSDGQQTQTMMPFITEHPIIRPLDEYGQWIRDALSQTQNTQECLT